MLDILGGDQDKWRGRLSGDFILNGNMMKLSKVDFNLKLHYENSCYIDLSTMADTYT